MTLEQKAAVERAADNINETLSVYASYYAHIVAGMQHVIDNPSDFGLVEKRLVDAGVLLRIETIKTCEETHLQNEKYREALERIAEYDFDTKRVSFHTIAKEALKQEDATCPKCGYSLFKHLGKTCCQGCDYVKQQ